MSDHTRTVDNANDLRHKLQQAIHDLRKDEDHNETYMEYCEGIYQACRAALGLITGDSK